MTSLSIKNAWVITTSAIDIDGLKKAGCPLLFEQDQEGLRLTFLSSLTKTLLLDIDSLVDLTLIFNDHVNAHVLLRPLHNGGNRVHFELKRDAQVHGYFWPHPQVTELKQGLTSRIAERAHLNLFEMGCLDEGVLELNTHVDLIEPDAQVSYCGLDQLWGTSQKRSHLLIEHQKPNTTSAQTFRGIYGGASLGHFLGKVIIHSDAKESRALQRYKSIIVSDEAKASVSPELEIYQDHVSAAHGATIGELDAESLFYLCSRGLTLNQARSILIMSLMNEVLEKITEPNIRQNLSEQVMTLVDKALEAV